jgi:hypothetical protein
MPDTGSPEYGTLIIAALLILALMFAGYWIVTYVQLDANPWSILPWFGIAALAIVVVGLLAYARPGRGGGA